jgi:SAM-dependent methyltransferase
MQTITDWAALWKEIVDARNVTRHKPAGAGTGDMWRERASGFDERVKQRWKRLDSTRKLILTQVTPDATFLDIGAGTGSWEVFLSANVRKITALEPSPAMRAILQKNLIEEKIDNVEIIQDRWPQAAVTAHDFVFCSHAMYGVADLVPFLRKMSETARQMCFFLIRAPSQGSMMSEAAQMVWGQPYDLPGFTIAYNVLLQMRIYANVQMEDVDRWQPQTSLTVPEALGEVKRKLGLTDGDITYDEALGRLLERRLIKRDEFYEWPGKMRSALIYWQVGGTA